MKEKPVAAPIDLVVRGGFLVTPEGIRRADLAVAEGVIVRVAEEIADSAARIIDAEGRWIFPGILDAHVHFNEPGRADWEGLASGSAALAAGGGTCFFDMPLNSEPPVLDGARLREKRLLAEQRSCVDFALWGGLVPGNLDQLAGLRNAGAIGLKAFMCASGIDSFPCVDAASLRAGMIRAAELGMLVAVHAEDDALAARLTAEIRAKGGADAKAYLASRPVEVELAAIRTALELAGETRCSLHIVHVSSPEGVALITEAKTHGVDVTAETCPHYLLLTDRDTVRMGAVAKCAPPLRDVKRREALWQCVRAGEIATIGSDHSPAPPALKTAADFFEVWGGIAGVQHGAELLLSEEGPDGDWPRLAAALSRNVARRFRIDRKKGRLVEGYDADFSLLEFGEPRTLEASELYTRHAVSPYLGRRSRARFSHTFVRGQAVWADHRLTTPAPCGRFIRPDA
jgi:allantoinase